MNTHSYGLSLKKCKNFFRGRQGCGGCAITIQHLLKGFQLGWVDLGGIHSQVGGGLEVTSRSEGDRGGGSGPGHVGCLWGVVDSGVRLLRRRNLGAPDHVDLVAEVGALLIVTNEGAVGQTKGFTVLLRNSNTRDRGC